MKKLYEFSTMIQVNIIVASETKEDAMIEIEHLGADGWLSTGDKLDEVSDISLDNVRNIEKNITDLDDMAHIIV